MYEESIEFVQKNENVSNKISEMMQKHAHLIKKKGAEAKEKEREKKDHKHEEIRKEIGTYNDGSMGAYGGKRYEGLGARDVSMRIFRNSMRLGGKRVKATTPTCNRNQSDFNRMIICRK